MPNNTKVVLLDNHYEGKALVETSMELARNGFKLMNYDERGYVFMNDLFNLTEHECELLLTLAATHKVGDVFGLTHREFYDVIQCELMDLDVIRSIPEVIRIHAEYTQADTAFCASNAGANGFNNMIYEHRSGIFLANAPLKITNKDAEGLYEVIKRYYEDESNATPYYYTLEDDTKVKIVS